MAHTLSTPPRPIDPFTTRRSRARPWLFRAACAGWLIGACGAHAAPPGPATTLPAANLPAAAGPAPGAMAAPNAAGAANGAGAVVQRSASASTSGIGRAGASAMTGTSGLDCLIEPEHSADVAASGNGTLASVLVERGQAVRKGQLLATLTDDVERAAVQASQQRAASHEEIAAAEVGLEVARARFARVKQLAELGYGSVQELDQAEGEARIAEHRLGQARDNREQATRQAQVAERQLQTRQIRSPFDGIIADRLLQPGERVDGRPVFRVLALDRLRIEVIAPSSVFGLIPEGAQVKVVPDVPKAIAHPARVVQADRYIDPASGTFRMRLSLPNNDHAVPAGVRCKVLVDDMAELTPDAISGTNSRR